MTKPKSQVDIGIDPENRKITLILPIDDFMECTKKSWDIFRESVKKDLIESKHIEIITKEK